MTGQTLIDAAGSGDDDAPTHAATQTVTQGAVLAAGLGTRMRPITNTIPKPLVQVAGKTLLDHALDALADASVGQVGVNVHYLADQIETHVAARQTPQVLISDERAELLDSGGGVKQMVAQLADAPFYILNADSFWLDSGVSSLLQMQKLWDHLQDAADMILLLARADNAIGFDGKGDFFMDDGGRLTRRGDADTAPFIYAGAIVARTGDFASVAEDVFSLNRLFDQAIAKGRLFGHILDGLWLHVGTPAAIAEAEAAIDRFRSGAGTSGA